MTTTKDDDDEKTDPRLVGVPESGEGDLPRQAEGSFATLDEELAYAKGRRDGYALAEQRALVSRAHVAREQG